MRWFVGIVFVIACSGGGSSTLLPADAGAPAAEAGVLDASPGVVVVPAPATPCTTEEGSFSYEGERCERIVRCSDKVSSLTCTLGTGWSCTCGTKQFLAKFTDCSALTDPDALYELCGFDVYGRDGSHGPITVVTDPAQPAFEQPPLTGCGGITVTGVNDTYRCEWSMQCTGHAVSFTCATDPHRSDGICSCEIDGKLFNYGRFDKQNACSTFDRAQLLSFCGMTATGS